MKEILKYLNTVLPAAGIPYQFGTWKGELTYPYFVGNYIESPPYSEDGKEEKVFTLTGWHKGSILELEKINEKVKTLFPPIEGRRVRLGDGSSLVLFYSHSQVIPTDVQGLEKMEINIELKHWRTN